MPSDLSEMQVEYIRKASHRWNIKTGATGSGKTYLDYTIMIPYRITACTGEGLIVLIGNTRGTLDRNILEPLRRAYGDTLVGMIRSDNTAMLFGKKVYCLGADKINQVAKIQGATIEYAYGDEVTTWTRDVFEMLKSRLRCPNSCFDGTCNPADPDHWMKKFIDSDADVYLQEYTIYDNPFLPQTFVDELCKEYAGTVYFDRFILGKWARAEGLVFRFFANDPDRFLFEDVDLLDDKGNMPVFSKLCMGIDFGGTGSKTTMVLTGYMNGYKNLRVLEETGLPLTDDIDAQDICDKFVAFYKECIEKYKRVDWIFPDSASPTLINSLRAAARDAGLRNDHISGCRKNEVSDRPRSLSILLNSGRLKINRRCEDVIRSLKTLVWDSKNPNIPEDKNIGNCNDWYDALNYTMLDFIEFIDLNR